MEFALIHVGLLLRKGKLNKMNKIPFYIFIFSLIFISISNESIAFTNGNSNYRQTLNNNKYNFEGILGSKKLGEHFSKIPSPRPINKSTPKVPFKNKCVWNYNLEDPEEDEKTVKCAYISSDGFIYNIEDENIIGIILKPDLNGSWKRQIPFGLNKDTKIKQLKLILSRFGYTTVSYKNEIGVNFMEWVCVEENGLNSKSLCFIYKNGKTLTSIEVIKGDT